MRTIFSLVMVWSSMALASYDLSPVKSDAPAPILIFVHGGAWISGNSSQYKDLATRLNQKNICVALFDYSLAPKAKHPTPVNELEKAISEISASKISGCDHSKIFLVGHSAGAHMIASWNTTYKNAAVKGFIGIAGIYDLPNLATTYPGYKTWFLESAFGPEKNWVAASPARSQPKSKAPWLLIHSTQDELVNAKQSTDFAEVLKKQKIEAELVLLKNEKHFEAVEHLGEASIATQHLIDFIKKYSR